MEPNECPPLTEMLKLEQSIRQDMRKFEEKVLELLKQSGSLNDAAINRFSKQMTIMAEMIRITAEKVDTIASSSEEQERDPVHDDVFSAMEAYIEIHRMADLDKNDLKIAKKLRDRHR